MIVPILGDLWAATGEEIEVAVCRPGSGSLEWTVRQRTVAALLRAYAQDSLTLRGPS
jgi:hypothetical protein